MTFKPKGNVNNQNSSETEECKVKKCTCIHFKSDHVQGEIVQWVRSLPACYISGFHPTEAL